MNFLRHIGYTVFMRQFRKRTLPLLALSLVILAFVACSDKKDARKSMADESIPTESFVIALIPERNVFEQKKRYQPLADHLSKVLGLNVKIKLLDSYGAIYSEMLQKKVDAAFFGSLSYIATNSKIDIDPLARPLRKDGTSTYRGLIFSLKDKGITEDVSTWKGRRIALVHRSTTAGYIFPRFYLHKKGVLRFEDYFRKVIYTGSHDAAVLSVLTGDADIGCASDLLFNKMSGENPIIRERLIILASSASVPAQTLGLRKDTDNVLKERLKATLMNLEKTPEGREVLAALGAVSFIETKEAEFGPIFEMLANLGLKPETFALEAIDKEAKSETSRKEATH